METQLERTRSTLLNTQQTIEVRSHEVCLFSGLASIIYSLVNRGSLDTLVQVCRRIGFRDSLGKDSILTSIGQTILYMQKLTEENQALKAQLEEYRAEVALQSMQASWWHAYMHTGGV